MDILIALIFYATSEVVACGHAFDRAELQNRILVERIGKKFSSLE